MRSVFGAVLVASAALGCGVREVPAPAAPAKRVPVGARVHLTSADVGGPSAPWADTRERTVPLCTTPCAADLGLGAHAVVFTSPDDPSKRSRAVIGVSRGATAVRHSLGVERAYGDGYAGGFILAFVGSVLTLAGAGAVGVGVASATADDARESDASRGMMIGGGVLTGLGALGILGGAMLMRDNQPVRGLGATTQFAVE